MVSPNGQLAEQLAVTPQENYVASSDDDTTGHGSDVLECTGYFAPNAEFETYRVVAPDGRAKRGNLVSAIGAASTGGVDLLNLSVGVYHSEHEHGDCNGQCRIAEETRLAVESGTTVVAATGNRELDDPLATHCPALRNEVIGVGGFVARCKSELIETEDSGQYWIRSDEVHGPFCGQNGCDTMRRCEENQFEQPWQGNVSFHNTVPDVLAPVHHPAGTKGDPVLQAGTSFGAGIVTGITAALLGDLSETDRAPIPRDVQSAITTGASDIDHGPLGKFDAKVTWKRLTGK